LSCPHRFGEDFYDGYWEEYPMEEGYDRRRTIYNFYHVANQITCFLGVDMGNGKEYAEADFGVLTDVMSSADTTLCIVWKE